MVDSEAEFKENLGTRRIPKLRMAKFPSADDIVRDVVLNAPRSEEAVDILLVNPPTPVAAGIFSPNGSPAAPGIHLENH